MRLNSISLPVTPLSGSIILARHSGQAIAISADGAVPPPPAADGLSGRGGRAVLRLALAASCSRQAVQKVCWQASVLGSLNVSMQIGQTSSCRAAWTRVRDLSREEEYASLSTSDIIFCSDWIVAACRDLQATRRQLKGRGL